MPDCRHGDGPAIARFSTPEGCVCFPEDREQDLCPQHIIKDGTIGPDVKMIADYRSPEFHGTPLNFMTRGAK